MKCERLDGECACIPRNQTSLRSLITSIEVGLLSAASRSQTKRRKGLCSRYEVALALPCKKFTAVQYFSLDVFKEPVGREKFLIRTRSLKSYLSPIILNDRRMNRRWKMDRLKWQVKVVLAVVEDGWILIRLVPHENWWWCIDSTFSYLQTEFSKENTSRPPGFSEGRVNAFTSDLRVYWFESGPPAWTSETWAWAHTWVSQPSRLAEQ